MTIRVAAAWMLLTGIAVAGAYAATPPLARLDDAYISLHSARVVLSGHDSTFEVPALIGVTSPAYVALLALLLATGASAELTALRLANTFGLVASVAAI
jgi:hypothetical protein